MLTVCLHKLVTNEKVFVGPGNAFRLSQNTLRDEHGVVIAVYSGGLWRTEQNCFLVMNLSSQVRFVFSNGHNKSVVHGPLHQIFAVDGTLHTGEGEQNILARLNDQTGKWMSFADQTNWPDIRFMAEDM